MIKSLHKMQKPKQAYDMLTFQPLILANMIHLTGFEFDGTACYRKGAIKGPDEIRLQSPGIESYSPYLDHDTTEISAIDIGNLPVGTSDNEEKNWREATDYFFSITHDINLNQEHIRFLTLGGEHSISYAVMVTYLKQYRDLVILHLDAHADLRDGYEGYHYSHASIIKRVSEHLGTEHQLVQYGIRSGTKEEFQWMESSGTLIHSKQEFLELIKKIDSNRPIYLTLDLDYFDPSFFPGTGTPEPGGEDFSSFIQMNKILKDKNFVGADVVELAPGIDPTGNSSVFASTVVRELLLALDLSANRI
jgi:agmatinase